MTVRNEGDGPLVAVVRLSWPVRILVAGPGVGLLLVVAAEVVRSGADDVGLVWGALGAAWSGWCLLLPRNAIEVRGDAVRVVGWGVLRRSRRFQRDEIARFVVSRGGVDMIALVLAEGRVVKTVAVRNSLDAARRDETLLLVRELNTALEQPADGSRRPPPGDGGLAGTPIPGYDGLVVRSPPVVPRVLLRLWEALTVVLAATALGAVLSLLTPFLRVRFEEWGNLADVVGFLLVLSLIVALPLVAVTLAVADRIRVPLLRDLVGGSGYTAAFLAMYLYSAAGLPYVTPAPELLAVGVLGHLGWVGVRVGARRTST